MYFSAGDVDTLLVLHLEILAVVLEDARCLVVVFEVRAKQYFIVLSYLRSKCKDLVAELHLEHLWQVLSPGVLLKSAKDLKALLNRHQRLVFLVKLLGELLLKVSCAELLISSEEFLVHGLELVHLIDG